MLSRLLLVVDALLIVGLVTLGMQLHAVWTVPRDSAAERPAGAAPANGAMPAAAPPDPGPALSAFSEIATKNLFNPLRTEEAPAPARPPEKAPVAPALPRPRLYGVVLGGEGLARAFLEDPRTRKTAGYAIGDSVAGRRLEEIKPDRVVLRGDGEAFEVLLRDPSKPRPPAPTVAGVPGAPPGRPGVPGARGAAPGVPGGAATPGAGRRGGPFTSPGGVPPHAGAGQPMPVPPGFLPTQPAAPPPGDGGAPSPPGSPVDSPISPTS